MREIELSETKEIHLQHHGWIRYVTTEDLKDGEIVFVKGIGECEVREITEDLVELWIAKGVEVKT